MRETVKGVAARGTNSGYICVHCSVEKFRHPNAVINRLERVFARGHQTRRFQFMPRNDALSSGLFHTIIELFFFRFAMGDVVAVHKVADTLFFILDA